LQKLSLKGVANMNVMSGNTSMVFAARVRRRGDRPPSNVMDIYLVNVGRQGILCLLAVKNGMGVAT
jgi:hypothetical protein